MKALLQRQWRCCTLSRSQHTAFSGLQSILSQSFHGTSLSEEQTSRSSLLASDQKTLGFTRMQHIIGRGSCTETPNCARSSSYVEKTSTVTALLVQEAQGDTRGRGCWEFCCAKSDKYAQRSQHGFMFLRSNLSLRALHTTTTTLAETEASQTGGVPDEITEDLEEHLAVYEELKEYVETRHANKPEFMKMLNEYNPLAEMKEPRIEDFRPLDRPLPPLDRVTIVLDTDEQYRVTRKTKWVTKQLRSPVMNDVPALLDQWVKTMYPKRSDWLDLLKEFNKEENEQALMFQISECALFEETFEVQSQDLTRIIVKYINLERYDDVDRLIGSLDAKGFPPDFVVCTLLLDMNCKIKRLDKAQEMFERIRSLDYVPDVAACTKLIEFYCESGNPEAGEMLLAEMEDEKLHGTVETYLAVLKGYGKQGKAAEAVRIFSMMNDDVFLKPHVGPDVYSALMDAYVQSNLLPSAVMRVEDMLHSGLVPHDKSISQLIAAFEKKNQFEKALDVLLKLESKAVRPGVDTLTTLIGWFGKMGLVDEAETLFKNIEEKVDVPDCKSYASLFTVYARAGSVDKAKAVLELVEEKLVVIDASAYEQMIISLLDGKQREEAQSMRDRMIGQGHTPSDEVERALLGTQGESFLSGASKPSEGETQSLGAETESFLAGVSKRLEEAPETL